MKHYRKQRFLCDFIKKNQETMILVGDTAHHLTRVLRLKTGDKIIVFDQSGYEWDAKISNKKRKSVEIELLDRHKPDVESPVNITLLQSISRSHRMDLVMQKATELGVNSIVPMLTKNMVVKLNAKNTQKKMNHWEKITISAAEQSGRVHLPELLEPRELSEDLLTEHKKEASFFLDTTGSENFSGNVIKNISIAIGPEGGFNRDEKNMAEKSGYRIIKTGPRLLRTETAPI
ncbi:MAG TPA: 16S rRNA (uracil(1498)-N(3))-methyltransferase, partial [Gammaproteobacteria bacterium]|nr:16S rRNA (uracil(1498)-N(3))-methyltransferase [Gammaproteobacteria bacterium]